MTDTPNQPTETQNSTPATSAQATPDPSTEPASSTLVMASVGDLAIRDDGVQIEVHGVRADENGQSIMTGSGVWIPVAEFAEFRSQS